MVDVGFFRITTDILCWRILFLQFLSVFFFREFLAAFQFESLLELPHSLSEDRTKSISHFNVTDFGAKGDGRTLDTRAFMLAWKKACSRSPSILEVPRGRTFLVGPIDFSGHCSFKIVLLVSGDIIAPDDPSAWEGVNPRKWLYFLRVNHLTVEGGGTINGRGAQWWDRSCKKNASNVAMPSCPYGMSAWSNWSPFAVTFHGSRTLKIKNLNIVNSPQIHMSFQDCNQVAVSGIKVLAPAESPNTDGIHISGTRHVLMKNVIVETGDDCISIVGNSSNIEVKNITCRLGHGISIGSLGKHNTWCLVQDVLIDGAFVSNTKYGLRIKTWQGGLGFVERIMFCNVYVENVAHPIIIDQYYCDSFDPCSNQTANVMVNEVTFSHVKGTSATVKAIEFACSDSCPCENLYLEDIQLYQTTGEGTKAFCWNALGISSGLVYPPPCFGASNVFALDSSPYAAS